MWSYSGSSALNNEFRQASELALEADRADALGGYREAFIIDDPSLIYLDGNSLGRLPKAVPAVIERVLRKEWGSTLIGSWNRSWIPLLDRVRTKLALLLGVHPVEVVVGDSTSIQLYKLSLAMARHFNAPKILTDARNFPSDLYVLEQVARDTGKELVTAERPDQLSVSREFAYGSVSHVRFTTGERFDLGELNDQLPMLWDLSHSVGVVPIDLSTSTAAVGCSYKYLNGGPGAPAFMYLQRDLHGALENPIPGWFGHDRPFEFESGYAPRPDAQRFQISTPAVLSLAAMEPGLDLVLEAGVSVIWSKACALTALFIELIGSFIPEVVNVTPIDPERRGAHVSLAHPEAWRICQSLIQHHHVVPDFRAPDLVRFGFSPLTTRYCDVVAAVNALRRVLDEKSYHAIPSVRPTVT
jgi:kynureninase